MANMIPVSSSNLVAVGYDENSNELYIQFKSGLYVYRNVPAFVYQNLLNAPSHGKFFHSFIKNAYPYSKIG